MEQNVYHTPVLLHNCLEGLALQDGGVYVDVTFGGGGHSRAILDAMGDASLYAFDQDADAQANLIEDERFHFFPHNFRYLSNDLRLHGVRQVDGILADLGVSSHQFDVAERGFSTRFDAQLDMRMDQDASISAHDVLHNYEREELIAVFKRGSDIKPVQRLVDAIIAARSTGLETTQQLKDAVGHLTPERKRAQYFAQVFQAIRIEVNQELEALQQLLEQAISLLKPGGRLVVMSYHSIEDRMVKHYIRAGNATGIVETDVFGRADLPLKATHRKVIVPTDEEVAENPRARSAKLRIAEKL